MTAAGIQTLQRARAILASIGELKAAVATNGEPQGRLRIGVAHALADAVLASSLDTVGRRFERLSLQLVSGWTPELTAMVERSELDAAIIMSAGDERSRKPIPGRIIGQDLITIIASSQVRMAKQPLLQHLDHFGWVLTPDEACGTRAALQHVIEQRGGQFRLAAEVHDIELQAALVEKGLGIGLMPKRKFEQFRGRGLQALTVRGLHFEMRILDCALTHTWTVDSGGRLVRGLSQHPLSFNPSFRQSHPSNNVEKCRIRERPLIPYDR